MTLLQCAHSRTAPKAAPPNRRHCVGMPAQQPFAEGALLEEELFSSTNYASSKVSSLLLLQQAADGTKEGQVVEHDEIYPPPGEDGQPQELYHGTVDRAIAAEPRSYELEQVHEGAAGTCMRC